MGVEPTWPAWKAGALPLSYTRVPSTAVNDRSRSVYPTPYRSQDRNSPNRLRTPAHSQRIMDPSLSSAMQDIGRQVAREKSARKERARDAEKRAETKAAQAQERELRRQAGEWIGARCHRETSAHRRHAPCRATVVHRPTMTVSPTASARRRFCRRSALAQSPDSRRMAPAPPPRAGPPCACAPLLRQSRTA